MAQCSGTSGSQSASSGIDKGANSAMLSLHPEREVSAANRVNSPAEQTRFMVFLTTAQEELTGGTDGGFRWRTAGAELSPATPWP